MPGTYSFDPTRNYLRELRDEQEEKVVRRMGVPYLNDYGLLARIRPIDILDYAEVEWITISQR